MNNQPMGYSPYGTFPTAYAQPQAVNVAIDFVEDDAAIERYATLPGVMTWLVNFNTMTITIKERDTRGVLRPYRHFNFSEFFPQAQNTRPVPPPQDNSNLQSQIDELKQIVLGMAQAQTPVNTPPQPNQQRSNKKGANG